MKSLIFAVVLLMVGSFSLPILAQQQDLQEIMNATNALGARQNELLGKKDAAGIASLFTSDGLDARSAIRVQARARRHTEALSRDH
jgi:hypothetical protein